MRKKYNRLMTTVVRNKQRVALKYFRTKEERDEFRHQVRIKEVEEHPEWSDIKKARNMAGMSIREMADLILQKSGKIELRELAGKWKEVIEIELCLDSIFAILGLCNHLTE